MSIFNTVNLPKPFRSKFNLTHERKFSCQIGRLIPFFCEEVIPDDKWSVQSAFRLELAPLIAPLMHNVDVYQYFFYVPNYLLSSSWNTWISQGEPADSPNIPYPFRFNLSRGDGSGMDMETLRRYVGPGTLLDYLGFSNELARTGKGYDSTVRSSDLKDYSSFPFLAYNAIWLNYFRNENFQPFPTEWGNPGGYVEGIDQTQNINLSDWKAWNFYYRNNVTCSLQFCFSPYDEDGSVEPVFGSYFLPHTQPRKANFMHDYFTSALPFTQRGPVVKIPLGETAKVVGSAQVSGVIDIDKPVLSSSSSSGLSFVTEGTTVRNKEVLNFYNSSGSSANIVGDGHLDNPITGISGNNINGIAAANVDTSNLEVDLSEATGISILDLRRFAKLQSWLEKNAIGGNTPGENIRNHFGVRPSDQSLDKPIFLGGGRVPIDISNVLQTSQSTDTSALATPSGYARANGYAGFRNRYFCEHGWILGLLYVMPRSTYMQGTRRYWDRKSRFDYFWMEFERIGEQPVYGYEIYDDGLASDENNGEFGYNPRYSDYKYIPSSVHGDFKTSLSFWHAARIFSERPKLNSSFLHLGDDINRIFAVDESVSDQKCWFWIRNSVKVRRPMLKNPTSILG